MHAENWVAATCIPVRDKEKVQLTKASVFYVVDEATSPSTGELLVVQGLVASSTTTIYGNLLKLKLGSPFSKARRKILIIKHGFTRHTKASEMSKNYPTTPDGRYFVHKERLWRCTNPSLDDSTKSRLVKELMDARRAVKAAKALDDQQKLREARDRVRRSQSRVGRTWSNLVGR